MRPVSPKIEQTCKTCGQEVIATETGVEYRKRWFGHFECTKGLVGYNRRPCKRQWKSSWTWTVNNQIQTTKCQTCKTSTLPYQIVSSICSPYSVLNYEKQIPGRNNKKRIERRRRFEETT